jgi:hypothetical protein
MDITHLKISKNHIFSFLNNVSILNMKSNLIEDIIQ